MPHETVDAVVIGAGPNGLVAGNVLADAGWEVLVLEEQPEPGGAVRSDRGVHPDYVNDLFSSFHPLAAASPVIRALDLERWGLSWSRAPSVLAHPLSDGRCAVLHTDPGRTAENLDRFAPGDGAAYLRLVELWDRLGPDLLHALFAPFPPVRATAALVRKVRAAGGLRFARMMTLPVRRLGEEEFHGVAGPLLLAGCALHADFHPESAASAGFGWLMAMLGQRYGWPAPAGGAGQLTDALVRRLRARGGTLACSCPVESVTVRDGRAEGVVARDGRTVRARRAVLADVPATSLYGGLVPWPQLPPRLRDDLRRFHWDHATFKVDWALSGPIPWAAGDAASAGTVHIGDRLDHLTRYTAQLSTGLVPDHPFALLGQMSTTDAARSPRGTESAWAYTHVPQHITEDAGEEGLSDKWDQWEKEVMAERVEREVERFAPGFRGLIRARRVLAPPDLEEKDANLHRGAINGGTAALHQQAVFRPIPGTGRPETPITGLYLASSSAHPGGGVHGACGANAARAALRAQHRAVRRLLGSIAGEAQRMAAGTSGRAGPS